MASSSRTISQTVWEAQRETILHLRFTEGLPLSNNKNGGGTVMQVMRDGHQFEATQSQYEQQLKRWGAAKHMKQSDWKSILPIYNHLKQQHLSPRIRLGETVLDERRVIKAQRRYFGQSEPMPIASITPRMSLAQNNLLKLDVRQHSGEYVQYSEFDATSNAEEIPSSAAPIQPATAYPNHQGQAIQGGQTLASGSRFNLATIVPESDTTNNHLQLEVHQLIGEGLEYSEFDEMFNAEATLSLTGPVQPTSINRNAQFQALQDDPTLASGNLFSLATLSPGFDAFRPNISPLEIDRGDEGIYFSPVIQQPWWANDPGSLLEIFALAPPTRSVTHVNERTRSPDLTRPRRLLFKPYVDSIFDRIILDIDQSENDLGDITAQMIAITLENLLAEDSSNPFGCISDMMPHRSQGVSQLPRIITSCFVNNLAGLDEFPICLLFRLLKADENVRESLLVGLRSNNVGFATALADCAFRSALRAGDEDIVAIILETTKGNINKIDLNSTVYDFYCEKCTPLGLAARMCHPGLVRKLVSFGAKIDVGELNAVIESWHLSYDVRRSEKKDAIYQIIELFLVNGASPDLETLRTVLQRDLATGSMLESLIHTVFKKSHWELLELRELGAGYFATLIRENAWAESLFFDLLKTCQSMGCSDTCKSTYSRTFDKILIPAITNGNFELASSLLDHLHPTVGSLTAAIRAKNFVMIQAFLSKSIDFGGCARCSEDLTSDYHCHGCVHRMDDTEGHCRPATPLAEAILWRNQHLISILEECGALDRVRDGKSGHLAAALVAAVRVGDVPRLKNLLRQRGTRYLSDLEAPIEEAICAGNLEMTKILFMSHKRIPYREKHKNLWLALKRRAYEIVFFLLECGSVDLWARNQAVLEAVRWGDRAVIECMYNWGFFKPESLRPFNPSDERVDFYSRNRRVPSVSALGEAMAARNVELVNRLLDWGADPSEHIPFAVGIGDENMVRLLLDQGGKPSGVEKTISNGQHSILKLLLDRGVAPVGLKQTVECAQHDMMCLLLRYGADPADEGAFCAALLCDVATFLSTLSEAFASRYPNGKRGFGFRALVTAMICCDTFVFKRLLLLNFDVNSNNTEEDHSKHFPDANILQFAIGLHNFQNICFGCFNEWHPEGCKCSSARRTDSEREDIITLLLEAGAGPENVSKGSTALLCAITTGRMQTVRLLLDRGVNVNRPAEQGLTRTPLQQACEEGDFEIIKFLLDKGADVNALPAFRGGATALQLAAIKGSQRIVRLLLDGGADIHGPKAAFFGRTALEGAAEHGRLSIINTLLTEGASGFGEDEIKSATERARRQGHRGCVKRLQLALDRLRNNNEALLLLRL
ncbi:unnamed protein product [Clonostachys solani]|uniref:Clr5 domain-containing protein n=1 Tax=Clonostachys solani TaxID=160281 RepID=A0A9P0EQV7_9HYPO|nr:unnamed protein product [Clonostachys solani]